MHTAKATATAVIEKTKEAAPRVKQIATEGPSLQSQIAEAAHALEQRFNALGPQISQTVEQIRTNPTVQEGVNQIKDKGPWILVGANYKKIPKLLREASALSLEGLTSAGNRVFHKLTLDKFHKSLYESRKHVSTRRAKYKT